jgi:hypothetical protein
MSDTIVLSLQDLFAYSFKYIPPITTILHRSLTFICASKKFDLRNDAASLFAGLSALGLTAAGTSLPSWRLVGERRGSEG